MKIIEIPLAHPRGRSQYPVLTIISYDAHVHCRGLTMKETQALLCCPESCGDGFGIPKTSILTLLPTTFENSFHKLSLPVVLLETVVNQAEYAREQVYLLLPLTDGDGWPDPDLGDPHPGSRLARSPDDLPVCLDLERERVTMGDDPCHALPVDHRACVLSRGNPQIIMRNSPVLSSLYQEWEKRVIFIPPFAYS